MILKVFLSYIVLWLATNITVLFSVALGVGDSFIVATSDDILHLSLGWAAVSSVIFCALSGCLKLLRLKNSGLVLNLVCAVMAVASSHYLFGQFFSTSLVVASVWTGLLYAVSIIAIATGFAWGISPASVNQNFWSKP